VRRFAAVALSSAGVAGFFADVAVGFVIIGRLTQLWNCRVCMPFSSSVRDAVTWLNWAAVRLSAEAPERLGCAHRCFKRRSARGGGIRGWLSPTRNAQFGMRPFPDRAGADVRTSVQSFQRFLRVPVSVFCF